MRKFVAILTVATGTAAGWAAYSALVARAPDPGRLSAQEEKPMNDKDKTTDPEWGKNLTPDQYKVLRMCGTERPFSGKYNDFWEEGTYACAGCGTPLFASKAKYEHGTGWPSFFEPIDVSRLELREDRSYLMVRTEVATFAAGCFWGVEHKFRRIPGVVDTQVGYTGGRTDHPSYEEVCTDRTGHAEAVEVRFDPSRVSYKELLEAFFSLHDPTQLNRQGPDAGAQYRSAIFSHGEEQRRQALEAVAALEASGRFRKPVVTQVVPAGEFTRAEEYHQRYYEKNGGSCRF